MTVFFEDKRLYLTRGGEFLTRLFSSVSYFFLAAATAVLFLSESGNQIWLAVILTLFLADRLLHFNEAEKSLGELKEEKANLADFATPAVHSIIRRAFFKSRVLRQDFYLTIFKELILNRDVEEILRRLSVPPEEILAKVEEKLDDSAVTESRTEVLKKIEELVVAACENAKKTHERFIEPRNVFAALCTLRNNAAIANLFSLFEIETLDLEEAAVFGRFRRKFSRLSRLPSALGGFAHRPRFLRKRVMNRAWTARPTPLLDQFSEDLTNLAREEKIGFLIGHEKEFNEILSVISRPGKPNVLLIGEPGVGKSTVIAHLAFRMVKDDVPPILFDKRLVKLELSSLLSGATPEIIAERLQQIADEIITADNIVLFIPNIHDFFRTGTERTLSAIDFFLPLIKRDGIPVIGETFPREFKEYIEPRTDFLSQFETVRIEEISIEEAYRFLIYNSLILEKEFKKEISLRAVKGAVRLAHRYFRNRLLPGSAVDLLKHALVEADRRGEKILTEDSVTAVAEAESRIPIQKAGRDETEKLLNLEELIHKKLV
ncbi:MAG TPA: AAA family ATPase, partial [Candidatus Paceibacterota bacterium]|nr:AAA family ATPase [Candidatus Paceibacterota bacterium]